MEEHATMDPIKGQVFKLEKSIVKKENSNAKTATKSFKRNMRTL